MAAPSTPVRTMSVVRVCPPAPYKTLNITSYTKADGEIEIIPFSPSRFNNFNSDTDTEVVNTETDDMTYSFCLVSPCASPSTVCSEDYQDTLKKTRHFRHIKKPYDV
jgi:hypothetical protein